MNSISKKTILAIASLFGVITAKAQRYSDDRLYDVVGLADGDEIADALAKGIPVIFVGFLIAYFTMWRKSNDEKKNNEGSNIGCLGVLLMGIGFLILIPLWTWVEAIATLTISAFFVLGIVVLIIWFIYEKLKS